MKTPTSPAKAADRRQIFYVSAGVLAFALLIATALFAVVQYMSRNHAREVADPISKQLIAAGATKKCEDGHGGYEFDPIPWYNAHFEVPLGKEEAIQLINKVAADNGFKLTHATVENKGPLGDLADQFVDAWYFDNTSKESPYVDLLSGKINLRMTVSAHGDATACKGSPLTIDATHSVIGLGVYLPEVKQQ